MPNNKCLTCKAGDETLHQSAVENTGCEEYYMRVDTCMKLHKGRVSACIEEWKLFRQCYEHGKAKKTIRMATSDAKK